MHFSITNVWQHSRRVLCSVRLKIKKWSLCTKLFQPNTYLLVCIVVQHWGRFILIYFHHDRKQIEVWITCDGLGLFCSFVSLFKHQTNKVEVQNIWICLVNNFNQIGYLSENYCKIFRAIYPICFCCHTQIKPVSDVMFYWCFGLLTCLLCLVSNIKCCSHTVSWWLKKFGNMFGNISCLLHEW